ncbi:hypothetical protein QT17_00820 [Thermus sp. 2.9]|nr:hypothetical protein QT17_00820 [Thermus sp. 2.9]
MEAGFRLEEVLGPGVEGPDPLVLGVISPFQEASLGKRGLGGEEGHHHRVQALGEEAHLHPSPGQVPGGLGPGEARPHDEHLVAPHNPKKKALP